MASPPFILYTNPGTPTSGRMAFERESVAVGRYGRVHGQPTGSAPDGVMNITEEIDPPLDRIKAQEMIEEFSKMPENWDGYGALRIRPETTQNALRVLGMLPDEIPMPDITTNPNGTISFEWESSAGVGHLEIGRTRFSFYIQAPHLDHPVLRDWQGGEPVPDVGQLLRSHLYRSAPHGRIIVSSESTRSSTAQQYFLPDNPDAHLSMAS